jgi:membrane protein YdbS with pleckstrin-like domain
MNDAGTKIDVGGLALDGTVHQLNPKVRIVWAVGATLPWVVLGGGGAIAASVTGHHDLAGLIVGVSLLLILLGVSIVGWRWRNWGWSAWDDALELHHGVITKRASVVPYHRIQQIDVHRDLIDRMLGLSKLILRTAAATTDAELPGIAAAHADELRHELLRRTGHDDAV